MRRFMNWLRGLFADSLESDREIARKRAALQREASKHRLEIQRIQEKIDALGGVK